LVFLILLFVLLREFSWSAVKRFVMLGVGLAVVLGPWAAYNVAVTRHVSLFMGTNGWHDMPASYSPEFLEKPGLKDFFERRERIFKAYEAEHGVQVRGDIRRALVGKEIWKEMMADPEIARLAPRLFIKKVVDELHALPSEWAVRVMAFVGIITLGARRLETWFLLAIPVGALVMIGLVHGDEGRLFSPCFPIVSIFAGIGMAGIVNGVVQAIRGQARTPASTPAIEKPSAPAG
jgi:4-amino-4-deoxy-L-arabinose transferase-like glycosyltransferase